MAEISAVLFIRKKNNFVLNKNLPYNKKVIQHFHPKQTTDTANPSSH